MDLYYYCSYDGSPVGFRIGRVNILDKDDEQKELSAKHIDPFIRRCFETGLIRSAFGKIPTDTDSQKKYFLLKKKMIGKKAGCNYYMNVAVVEDEWDKFSSLMHDCDDEAKLATAVMNSIEPVKDDSFGYKVNTHKLSDVLSFGYAGICNCNEARMRTVQQNDTFFVTLSTANPDRDILKSCLGIAHGKEMQTEILKESGKVFRIGKKT